jgi:hypothetical protein
MAYCKEIKMILFELPYSTALTDYFKSLTFKAFLLLWSSYLFVDSVLVNGPNSRYMWIEKL